jgi:hypothetical protein
MHIRKYTHARIHITHAYYIRTDHAYYPPYKHIRHICRPCIHEAVTSMHKTAHTHGTKCSFTRTDISMLVSVHIFIHVCMRASLPPCLPLSVHDNTLEAMYMHVHDPLVPCPRFKGGLQVCSCILCLLLCLFVHVSVCVCVCVCEREREREREREKQSKREWYQHHPPYALCVHSTLAHCRCNQVHNYVLNPRKVRCIEMLGVLQFIYAHMHLAAARFVRACIRLKLCLEHYNSSAFPKQTVRLYALRATRSS